MDPSLFANALSDLTERLEEQNYTITLKRQMRKKEGEHPDIALCDRIPLKQTMEITKVCFRGILSGWLQPFLMQFL